MTTVPAWLPPQLRFIGDWNAFLRDLYTIFTNDFKNKPRPEYDGFVVLHDNRLADSDMEEGFWHLISKAAPGSSGRLPDLRRAEKLPWANAVIENASSFEVLNFDYREANGKIRTYLWLRDHDYVVILEKRRKVAFLITAFHVEYESARRKLERQYKNRV